MNSDVRLEINKHAEMAGTKMLVLFLFHDYWGLTMKKVLPWSGGLGMTESCTSSLFILAACTD